MAIVLVVAPHPDDETLGCGGALLRHAAEGDAVHWLIATDMTREGGFSPDSMARRDAEIEAVAKDYGFAAVHRLGFGAARLDAVPPHEGVAAAAAVLSAVEPEWLYLPHPGDAHGDHAAAFRMVAGAAKWFRLPSLRRVQCYETLSETGFGLDPGAAAFAPNTWVDVGPFLERKLAILSRYAGELGAFPFPRSAEAVRSLARVRGAEAGYVAAEAFQTLRERR